MGCGLVELHSVLVSIDENDGTSNEIYGEIKVKDCAGRVFDIYKAEKNSAKPISADGTLPLSGLSECIINPPEFAIGVSLKEKHQGLEVSNGFFCLSLGAGDGWYERPVSAVIQGEHGYVVLHLSLFNNAVQATVDVVLVTNGDFQKPRHAIHGSIAAKYSKYEYKCGYAKKYHQSTMFNVPQDKPLELQHVVEDNEPTEVELHRKKIRIPLSRCTVAVPAWSHLLIEAHLCENLGIDSRETSEVLSAGGIASFYADYNANGKINEVIEGQNGLIEVEVTWHADVLKKVYNENVWK